VKGIFVSLATAIAFFAFGCGFFGNTGEVRQEQSRSTVFKSGAGGQIEDPTVTPSPQKIPEE
jgi:hypothetical protein